MNELISGVYYGNGRLSMNTKAVKQNVIVINEGILFIAVPITIKLYVVMINFVYNQ